MFNTLSQETIEFLLEGELGINVELFMKILQPLHHSKFIDLGVETGKSSMILLHRALEKNNKVWGVDPIKAISENILKNPNYTFVQQDSYKTGKDWNNGKVNIIFVDSIHVDVQVLAELNAWWPHLDEQGWIILHDTNWANYIHKSNHQCAGKKPGNSGLGYDSYGGRVWNTPDVAVKKFFKLEDLNYENEYIKSIHGPESLGMTFVQKKLHYDYGKDIYDWDNIFKDRNFLLRHF